jgi:hypothetical protein
MLVKHICTALLVLLIAGCGTPQRSSNTATVSALDPTNSPAVMGDQEPPPPSTSLSPGAACPVPLGAPDLPSLANPTNWAAEILTYLNQGGSLSGLTQTLPASAYDQGLTAAIADLNGDGYEDFALKLDEETQSEGQQVERALFIYLCDKQAYRLVYASNALPDAHRLHLHQVMDLTGDGIPEILLMQEFCGAHTCFQAWQVLRWNSEGFTDILDGRSDDLPSPILEIDGPRPDGSMILAITGTGVSSAGAGPPRPITRIWHWSSEQGRFKIIGEQLAAPTFRIHALFDADQAALAGDRDAAMRGYLRVIEDPDLDDYPYGEDGQARLSAYALYRRMLLWIQSADLGQAENTLSFLLEAHPPGSPGEGFSALATEVWEAYQTQLDLGRACQIGQAFAAEHADSVLEPLHYGYANPTYTPFDICPYSG